LGQILIIESGQSTLNLSIADVMMVSRAPPAAFLLTIESEPMALCLTKQRFEQLSES